MTRKDLVASLAHIHKACAGMAAVLKSVDADIIVVGCQPEASDVMRASVAAGRIVDQSSGETLSDGSAGGIVSF